MPCPVLMYQPPLGLTPARAHRVELLGVRARGVGAGRERRVGGRDGRERRGRVAGPRRMRRVVPGAEQDEVVVHHRCPARARAPGPCTSPRRRGSAPAARRRPRRRPWPAPRPDPTATVLTRHRLPDSYVRHQRVEQARVLGARRRAEDERPPGRARGRARGRRLPGGAGRGAAADQRGRGGHRRPDRRPGAHPFTVDGRRAPRNPRADGVRRPHAAGVAAPVPAAASAHPAPGVPQRWQQ